MPWYLYAILILSIVSILAVVQETALFHFF
jgi:hypothetical protein